MPEPDPIHWHVTADLPRIPIVEADCPACGNPTLIVNIVDGLGDLCMPGLPLNAIACCLEGCPAMYQPIELR